MWDLSQKVVREVDGLESREADERLEAYALDVLLGEIHLAASTGEENVILAQVACGLYCCIVVHREHFVYVFVCASGALLPTCSEGGGRTKEQSPLLFSASPIHQ